MHTTLINIQAITPDTPENSNRTGDSLATQLNIQAL